MFELFSKQKNKTEFLLEDLKNIQYLIRFTYQKVGMILLFIILEITIVSNIILPQSYALAFDGLNAKQVVSFVVIALFFISITICLYIALIGIIKPQLANNRKGNLFYFEDIDSMGIDGFTEKTKAIKEIKMNKDISEQIVDCSKILKEKSDWCSKLTIVTFLSFVFMLGIIIVDKIPK